MQRAAIDRRPLRDLVGELLSGWPLNRLGGEADPERPVIQVKDIAPWGAVDTRALGVRRLPSAAVRCSAQRGDIILVGRGSSDSLKPARVAIVGEGAAGAIVASNLILMRPGLAVRSEVLCSFLLTDEAQAELQRRKVGSVTQAFKLEDVAALEAPTPDADTQRRIASVWHAAQRSYVEALAAAEDRLALGRGLIECLLRDGAIDRKLMRRKG